MLTHNRHLRGKINLKHAPKAQNMVCGEGVVVKLPPHTVNLSNNLFI